MCHPSSNIMKKSWMIATLFSLTLAKPNHKVQIVGGQEAEPHAYPWQVSLRSWGNHICGGSIINERQVLCAAHCVQGQMAFFDAVVAGAHEIYEQNDIQFRHIKTMEAHESFEEETLIDDISIITVTEPFDFSDPHVQPVPMFKASMGEPVAPGTTCVSTGWGFTHGGDTFPPRYLQEVSIDILSFEECSDIFPPGSITDGMICAGKPGAGPCNGDSGGPLVCPDADGNFKLAGIVSWGEAGCTNAGVYTRVSQYEQWISDKTF